MIDARFRILTTWPREMTKGRKNATFRASYPQTLSLLEDELRALRAKEINIQVALRPEDIRLDGWPRANARTPSHPGVIVSFESRFGPLSYACDTYTTWEDNLRAIAKTLENLRAVERYGATKHGEQYRGYAQIEAPKPEPEGDFSNAEQAARWLSVQCGHMFATQHVAILASSDLLKEAYREAAKRLHPDKMGGSEVEFKRLQEAKRLLDAHHERVGR
jgi:hypothetical protein